MAEFPTPSSIADAYIYVDTVSVNSARPTAGGFKRKSSTTIIVLEIDISQSVSIGNLFYPLTSYS